MPTQTVPEALGEARRILQSAPQSEFGTTSARVLHDANGNLLVKLEGAKNITQPIPVMAVASLNGVDWSKLQDGTRVLVDLTGAADNRSAYIVGIPRPGTEATSAPVPVASVGYTAGRVDSWNLNARTPHIAPEFTKKTTLVFKNGGFHPGDPGPKPVVTGPIDRKVIQSIALWFDYWLYAQLQKGGARWPDNNPYAYRYLFMGLIQSESSWVPNAEGGTPDIGLCQLTHPCIDDMGFSEADAYNTVRNMECSVLYLLKMIKRFKWDVVRGLVAYNAGPGNASRMTDEQCRRHPYPRKVLKNARAFNPGDLVPLNPYNNTYEYLIWYGTQGQQSIMRYMAGINTSSQATLPIQKKAGLLQRIWAWLKRW